MTNEFLDECNSELRKALNLSAIGQTAQALELIDEYISRSETAPAYRAKAMVLSVAQRYHEAAGAMRVAVVRSTTRDPAYLVELGEYLIQVGSFEEAYASLSDAVALIKKTGNSVYFQTALLARAVAAVKAGMPRKAREDTKFLDEDSRLFCAGELWSKEKLLSYSRRGGEKSRSSKGSG